MLICEWGTLRRVCETMSHQLLPKLTSSFASLFPLNPEEPRTTWLPPQMGEKQNKAWMAEDRIFILRMVETMFCFWDL
jgi:hypothetical protein